MTQLHNGVMFFIFCIFILRVYVICVCSGIDWAQCVALLRNTNSDPMRVMNSLLVTIYM